MSLITAARGQVRQLGLVPPVIVAPLVAPSIRCRTVERVDVVIPSARRGCIVEVGQRELRRDHERAAGRSTAAAPKYAGAAAAACAAAAHDAHALRGGRYLRALVSESVGRTQALELTAVRLIAPANMMLNRGGRLRQSTHARHAHAEWPAEVEAQESKQPTC